MKPPKTKMEKVRRSLFISLRDVEKETGICRTTLSQYENNQKELPTHHRDFLATHYNCNMDDAQSEVDS